MTRSSRHKSHRSHKHSSRDEKDRSDSEDERDSRDQKRRGEERDSRDSEPGKRKLSHEKDRMNLKHGKKQRDKDDDTTSGDRWSGGGEEDGLVDEGSKGEGFVIADSEKSVAKGNISAVDSEGKSNRRRENSSERYEESVKRKSEKESSRRESSNSNRYRDEERDKKKGQDSRNDRSDEAGKRGYIELETRDDLLKCEFEKDFEKHNRSCSRSVYKGHAEGRDGDDKRLSSRGDFTRNGSYKDDRHRDERSRNKYQENVERDQRLRDEQSSRNHSDNKSDSKHYGDKKGTSERQSKKSKLHDNEHDGSPYLEDHGTKFKDAIGRKRSFDENDGHSEPKLRSSEEASNKLEFLHEDRVDSTLHNTRSNSSAGFSTQRGKDQSSLNSKQAVDPTRVRQSEKRSRSGMASLGAHPSVSEVQERLSASQSVEKSKLRDGTASSELLMEMGGSSQCDRTSRSEGHISPIPLSKKSPSSASEHQCSDRSGSRRSADIEDIGKSSVSNSGLDDRMRGLPLENQIWSNHSEEDLRNSEQIPSGSSSISRPGHISGSSPGHLSPLPPFRYGIDSPSVLGSFEDDSRVKNGDRKSSNRYKRNGDFSMDKGQRNVWKSGPTWPTPLANGFISFQHGPPPPGFMQQFPAPSLFGMRPPMDLSHTGLSYQLQDMTDRFSGHGRSFAGWHDPVDDSCSQLQGWDGNSGVFGQEPNFYGRPDWDQNGHLVDSRGWEMNAVKWKGQGGSMNMEFPVPQKKLEYSTQAAADDARVGQLEQQSWSERGQSKCARDEKTEMKISSILPEWNSIGTPKSLPEKAPTPCKIPTKDSTSFCWNYLSKLDISLDLSRPELYEQCIALLAPKEPWGICDISSQDNTQIIRREIKGGGKTPNLSSLFPATPDAIFQRAISLYNKRSGMKVKFPALPLCSTAERDSPETISNLEKAKGVDDQAQEPRVPSVPSDNSECSIEGTITVAQENQSDHISDVCVEDSQECEPLGPKCGIHLSRIHNSLGIKH